MGGQGRVGNPTAETSVRLPIQSVAVTGAQLLAGRRPVPARHAARAAQIEAALQVAATLVRGGGVEYNCQRLWRLGHERIVVNAQNVLGEPLLPVLDEGVRGADVNAPLRRGQDEHARARPAAIHPPLDGRLPRALKERRFGLVRIAPALGIKGRPSRRPLIPCKDHPVSPGPPSPTPCWRPEPGKAVARKPHASPAWQAASVRRPPPSPRRERNPWISDPAGRSPANGPFRASTSPGRQPERLLTA